MHWVWVTKRETDGHARLSGRPAALGELGLRFDEGRAVEVAVPPLVLLRDRRDPEARGTLTDNLVAPGLTGLAFSTRLREVLSRLGVNTLQYFPLALEDQVTGETSREYQLANVVGRQECIEVTRSVLQRDPTSGAIEFIDALCLDEAKLGDRLMFRAAEHSQLVIVHQSVREACLESGITGVAFSRPEDFTL